MNQQSNTFRVSARHLLRFVLLGAAFSALSLWACSVPVFRYALEHWRADACPAVVFHRGLLTEAQHALVRDLSTNGLAGQLHANLSPKTVDLDDKPSPEMLELFRQSGAGTLPWLVVKGPWGARSASTIWSGPLTERSIKQLLDSPARKEIVDQLAQGQSAVWVLLESGDRERDAAAAQLVESRLAYLARTLMLPKLDPQDIVNGLVSISQEDLRLEFSLLRLARHNPEEQPFIQMLLGTEPDLKDAKEPIVFPVFGRGRALYALVGAGITRETIDQAATFLIGKCSCQVKEQNPGVDLLLAADWDKLVKAQASAAPNLPSLSELTKSAPMTVTFSGGSDTTKPSEASSASPPVSASGSRSMLASLSIVGGVVVFAVVAAGILLRRNK